ncbi:MAG: methyltransferase domain-containing protein [Desulfovibrio sp.]|nr:methyltransferase domain-containing protein [Desulfovibrio sp.]
MGSESSLNSEQVAKQRALFPRGLSQPRGSYHFGQDALLLARFAHSILSERSETIAELGCGSGASLCLLALLRQNIFGLGFEKEAVHIACAKANTRALGLDTHLSFVHCDLSSSQSTFFFQDTFDALLANPPFYDKSEGHAPKTSLRDTALRGDNALALFCDCATRLLRHHGFFFCIYPASKTQKLFAQLADSHFGLRYVAPLFSHHTHSSRLFIAARKNAKEDCQWLTEWSKDWQRMSIDNHTQENVPKHQP